MPTTSYAKMIDIWMIFCMLNPFCEVFIHALRQTLKNTTWMIKDLKRRIVVLVSSTLVFFAVLFLLIFWAAAMHHYLNVSITRMATKSAQACVYHFV